MKVSKYVLPRFIQTRQSDSYAKVFAVIWQQADEQGEFVLDAQAIADQTGISRKTVYGVLAYLKEIRLSKINRPVLEVIDERRGRGQHSRYCLNWKRIAPKFSSKCHTPHRYKKNLRYIHPTGDTRLSPQNNFLWRKVMVNFRGLLNQSKLNPGDRNTLIAMLGRQIKFKPMSKVREIFHEIERWVNGLTKPKWIRTARHLCAWFLSIVQGKSKPRPDRTKRRPKFEDANERIWEMVAREKEAVMQSRGDGGYMSAADSWREWALDREADLRYRKLLAEQARIRLRERKSEMGLAG